MKYKLVIIVIVLLFGNISIKAQKMFTLPLQSSNPEVVHGWYYNNDTPGNPHHKSIDYLTTLNQPIVTVNNGVALATYSSSNSGFGSYGHFIIVRHNEVNAQGKHYMTVYAHLNGVAAGILQRPEGHQGDTDYENWTQISRGQIIGYAGQSGTTWIHLHFETFVGDYVYKASNRIDPYDIYDKGFRYPPNDAMGNNYLWTSDPPVHYNVGCYAESPSWHNSSHPQLSLPFADAYNRHPNKIGQPNDNGGGTYVHEWYGKWIQDFYKETGECISNTRHTAIVLNPNPQTGEKSAGVLVSGFREFYLSMHNAPYNLGSPIEDERVVNSNGDTHQKFKKSMLMWIKAENKIYLYHEYIFTPHAIVDIIQNESSQSSSSAGTESKTVRKEEILKTGEKIVQYFRNGKEVPALQPQSTLGNSGYATTSSSSSGVEIWHDDEFLGYTPLQIEGYEEFLYELTAKVDGEDVPVTFTAYDGLIVEVPGGNPTGGGIATAQSLTITPQNPNPGGDNVTLVATLENSSGNSAFYDYIELIILDENFQSTGLREIEFDVTIADGNTHSISRTFSVTSAGEYYAAVRYSVDNINWSYFNVSNGEVNPEWFRVGSAPTPIGEIKVSSFTAQNADNLEPNEPHTLELQVTETLNEAVLYDIGIRLLDSNMNEITGTMQLAYWDSVALDPGESWTGITSELAVENTGQYYYEARGFNYHTSQWTTLATTGTGVNPISVEVTEDSVVHVTSWSGMPDTVKVDSAFTVWCATKLPVGDPITYDTVAFQILDYNQEYLKTLDRKFTNEVYNAGTVHSLPVEFLDTDIHQPGNYYIQAVGYRNDQWEVMASIWGLDNPRAFYAYADPIFFPENIIANSGFETGDFTYWSPYYENGTVSIDTVSQNGSYSQKMSVNTAGEYWTNENIQLVPVEANKEYIVSFFGKASSSRTVAMNLTENGNDWTWYGLWYEPALTTDWRQYEHLFTVNTTDTLASFTMQAGNTAGVVWLDDMLLAEAVSEPVGDNLLANSNFEYGYLYPWTTQEVNGYIGIDNNQVYYSNFSVKIDVNTAGENWETELIQLIPVESGQQYTLSFYAKASTSRQIYVNLTENEGDWTWYGLWYEPTLTTGWQYYETIFTANTTDNNANFHFPVGFATGTIWFDDISLQASSQLNKQSANQPKPISRLPKEFKLHHNYPNPFNPTTTLKYELPKAVSVKIMVYNLLGQRVITLVDEYQEAGFKSVIWHGKNDSGQKLSSGMYFYHIEAGNFTQIKKMLLLK